MKTRWSVSDFIKAFIKFHGHVYLSKSLEKLSPLREKLEEQFKVSPNNILISILRKIFLAAKFWNYSPVIILSHDKIQETQVSS